MYFLFFLHLIKTTFHIYIHTFFNNNLGTVNGAYFMITVGAQIINVNIKCQEKILK